MSNMFVGGKEAFFCNAPSCSVSISLVRLHFLCTLCYVPLKDGPCAAGRPICHDQMFKAWSWAWGSWLEGRRLYFPWYTQNKSIWRKLEPIESIRQNNLGSPEGLMCLQTGWLAGEEPISWGCKGRFAEKSFSFVSGWELGDWNFDCKKN